jgi:flagellar biosynthetic protein FliP
MPRWNRRARTARRAATFGCWMSVAAGAAHAQTLSLNLAPAGGQSLATNLVSLVALTSVLAIAPGILVMGTAFTRLVVVLSMLRTALGLQQTPPNSVIISLAMFLTAFIMAPAFETAYRDGLQPMMDGSITEEQAFDRTVKPFRGFMEANTADKDLVLFMDLGGWKPPAADPAALDSAGPSAEPKAARGGTTGGATPTTAGTTPGAIGTKPGSVSRSIRADIPLRVLCPAFLVSELSKAFQIGFLLFLPFLVIDIAISAVLMGMGMMMLPPVVVSLPFKLIFFVLVSGWELVAGSLVRSFSG